MLIKRCAGHRLPRVPHSSALKELSLVHSLVGSLRKLCWYIVGLAVCVFMSFIFFPIIFSLFLPWLALLISKARVLAPSWPSQIMLHSERGGGWAVCIHWGMTRKRWSFSLHLEQSRFCWDSKWKFSKVMPWPRVDTEFWGAQATWEAFLREHEYKIRYRALEEALRIKFY